jgi:hypothetical protein
MRVDHVLADLELVLDGDDDVDLEILQLLFR